MKKMIFLVVISFTSGLSYSQTTDDLTKIASGHWMFEVNPTTFLQLYKMNFFLDQSGSKVTISELLENEEIDLNKVPYGKIRYGEKEYLAVKRRPESDIRLFKILRENNAYFILCSNEEDICECRANTFFFFKAPSKLQRIEKPFSFSLKNNLVKRLEEYDQPIPSTIDSLSFCETLNNL